jgi:hypothetical protein
MQIPVVRRLVQAFTLDQLRQAERCLLDELPLPIEVSGEDEGEQLTHILGAIWILEQIEQGMTINEALRAFTLRVRNSIQS